MWSSPTGRTIPATYPRAPAARVQEARRSVEKAGDRTKPPGLLDRVSGASWALAGKEYVRWA
jgi:hypothetical protein